MPTTTPNQVISALYVATFNRAPDNAGYKFWQQQFTVNSAAAVQQLAAGFAGHPAFTQLYGNLNNLDFVKAIYVNVLGQPGDSEGILFWNSALSAGLSRSNFLAAFVESALTVDINSTNFPNLSQAEIDAAIQRQDYLINKANVGIQFTNTLGAKSNLLPTTNPNILTGPNGLLADPAYQASIAILGGVTSDPASAVDAVTLINTANATADPIDYINDHALPPPGQTFTLTTNVDVVNPSNPNAGDVVTGVVDGLPVAIGGSTYTNGDIVNGNGKTIVELTVQDLLGTGVAAVATLNDIHDVNIIAAASGTMNFNAVNWSNVGAVNLDRGADGLSVFVDLLEDGTDLSIASGISGSLSADYVSGLEIDLFAGKVSSVLWDGNVDATVAANETVSFDAFIGAGDLTVGNIDATVAKSGIFDVSVSSTGTGDIKVGNVKITGADDVSISVSVSNTSGDSVTVGNVSQVAGDNSVNNFYVFNQGATGSVLVGNVSMSVGQSGALDVTIDNTGTTDQSLGSLTVGTVALTLGPDATGSLDITNSNTFSIDGLSLGALTVGDMTVNLGADSTLDVSITQQAVGTTGHALASFGDVSIGKLGGTLGIGASMDYSLSVTNSLSGDIASVKVGDVNLKLDDAASLSYEVSVTADKGDITSFVMGDVNLDLGVSATVNSFDVNLFATGNIGKVDIGDLSINAGKNATAFVTVSLSATDSIGELNVGVISLDTVDDASVSVSITSTGGVSDGDINIAGLSLGGSDKVTFDGAAIFVGVAGGGFSGNIDLGDISVGVSLTGITALATSLDLTSILASVSTTAGDITIGSVDYSGLVLKWAAGNPDTGNGVVIDLTNNGGVPTTLEYKGNTTVIGSDYNDIIFDNTGANKLTGGDGADLFNMNATNTGKTLTTIDTITDFEHNVDTIHFDTTAAAPTAGEYFEASYADFNAFLAGASTQMTSVPEDNLVAGQVGNNTFVAIDANDNDAIDFVIQLTGVTLANLDFADFAFN